MIELLFTSVFYLVILVILGLMALLVRLYSYGTTEILEPDGETPPKHEKFLLALKDTPENNPVEDEVAQKQKVAEINSELQDKKEPGSCLVPLAEKSSESKPRRGIRRQQLPSRQKLAANAVLSPLTLFLLGAESTPTYDPVYEKLLRKKRSRWRNRTLNRARKPRAFSK